MSSTDWMDQLGNKVRREKKTIDRRESNKTGLLERALQQIRWRKLGLPSGIVNCRPYRNLLLIAEFKPDTEKACLDQYSPNFRSPSCISAPSHDNLEY
jgi:hypothetical protein